MHLALVEPVAPYHASRRLGTGIRAPHGPPRPRIGRPGRRALPGTHRSEPTMAAKKKAARKKAAKKKTAKNKTGKKKASKKKSAAKKRGKGAKGRDGKKAGKAKPAGPVPVATGKGPGPAEVAARVTELLRTGRADEVEQDWLASHIESVEGHGASMAWSGKPQVLAKYRAWEADHEMHDMQVEGPWVGATGFVLKFRVDATQRSTGQRMQMEEMAVYTVKNGRIAREEFHFATGG